MRKFNFAFFQLFMGALAVGLAPIFVKLLTGFSNLGPIAVGFWRMLIGSVGFAVTISVTKVGTAKSLFAPLNLRSSSGLIFLTGLMFACDLAAWHTSLLHTSVANSTLISNLTAILVPTCGVVFFKEKLKKTLIIGGFIAVIGLVGLVITKNSSNHVVENRSWLFGEGLALLTAFFYTAYMLSIKRLTLKFRSLEIMFFSSIISAFFLVFMALSTHEKIMPSDVTGWIWIAGIGLVSQVLGQGLIAKALGVLPVSQSALILLLAPASSAVFSWIILGEFLSSLQAIFILLTLLGIAVVARGRPTMTEN